MKIKVLQQKIGSWLPIGSGNAEKEAFVEKISYVLVDEVPVELTKLKKVIQKLDLVTVRYDVRVVRKGFLSFFRDGF